MSTPFDCDKLKEECGVFAIFNNKQAAVNTALGLHSLQHRGQEAAGTYRYLQIFSVKPNTKHRWRPQQCCKIHR